MKIETLDSVNTVNLNSLVNLHKFVGPFDGILGFSQGGAIAALMACRLDIFYGLKFVILAGAPDMKDLQFPSATPNAKLTTRSLHFAGALDAVVPPEHSLILASRFQSPQYVEHPQGHCIPTKPQYVSMISTFLESQLNSNTNSDLKLCGMTDPCANHRRSLEGDDCLSKMSNKRKK